MKAIKVQTDAGHEMYIELSEEIMPVAGGESGGTIASAGKAAETIKKLDEVGDAIADVCRTLQDRIQTALGTSKPSELTLEFGVKLAGEAGIPLVTKGSVEGTFQVTTTWNFK
jgi:Trypsin-co-occurring domain 1